MCHASVQHFKETLFPSSPVRAWQPFICQNKTAKMSLIGQMCTFDQLGVFVLLFTLLFCNFSFRLHLTGFLYMKLIKQLS